MPNKINLSFLSLFMLFPFAKAADLEWKPVNIQTGCVEFSDLYNVYPILEGSDTPEKIVKKLKQTEKNVRMISVLEMSKNADIKNEKESPLLKVLTKKNAYHISWGEGNFMNGILLYSQEVCDFVANGKAG